MQVNMPHVLNKTGNNKIGDPDNVFIIPNIVDELLYIIVF